MNPEKLNEIEARWAKASSGPWTVLDYTSANSDVPTLSFAEALSSGLTPSAEAWIEMIESTDEGLTYDLVADACPMIVPTTPTHVAIEDREQDRILDGGTPKKASTPPMLAVLGEVQGGHCRPEDLQFILNASVDVGLLLRHIHDQQTLVDDLRAEVARLRGRSA